MESLEKILQKSYEITALIPIYEKNLGNITKLTLKKDESIIFPQSIESVLRNILAYYGLYLRLLRRKQQKLLNCKYYTPLPINKGLLLFPVKIRVPKIKNDSSIGYINFFQVEKMDYKHCCIHLTNGEIIKSLNTPSTLRKRYHQALLSAKLFEENPPPKEEYLYPLTKRDIEAVVKELSNIRGILASLSTTFLKD